VLGVVQRLQTNAESLDPRWQYGMLDPRRHRRRSSAKRTAVNGRPLVRRQKWCWLAIAALVWCGCAAALDPELTIKELHHTDWGPGQGAPLRGAPPRSRRRTTAICGSRARADCFDSTELRSSASNPKLYLSLRSAFFSARRGLVGRLHVCRRSARPTYLTAGPATKPASSAASAELHKWARPIYKHACSL